MINKSKYHVYLTMFFMFVACLSLSVTGAWAQESSKEFQESTEDFIKALDFEGARPKSLLPPEAIAKGPAMITYDELTKNPIARSKIHFDFDSDAVKQESYRILQNLSEVLTKQYPEAILIIAGHTDSTGPKEYNMALSQRRTQAVKDVLVDTLTIQSERLILRWFGENEPMASNDTKEGRSKNRRVDFIRIQ